MRNAASTCSFKWFEEVWNKGRREAIDELLASDILIHGLGANGAPLQGSDHFKQYYDALQQQFQDIHFTVEDVISQDDMESARCTATATHKENGRQVRFCGLSLVRIQNGKFVEAWNYFDFLSMYRQLGQELPLQ
ncbi:ester cyclase [Paraflavisolibacter sp. H34]|uniref:ester cyclase n=1 Tax=Huijunlia imazamoxiresistens TaxID=3127457 RepID=UPI00301A89E1